VNFLGGDPEAVRAAGAVPASTFEDAAAFAALIALGQPLVPFAEQCEFQPSDVPTKIASHLRRDQRTIRGLYTGGSLAGEAKLILETLLGSERAHQHR